MVSRLKTAIPEFPSIPSCSFQLPSNRYRSHRCGELRLEDVGSTVRLAGWLSARRDHGQLMFLHLRDFYGITQVVIETGEVGEELFARLQALNFEAVLSLEGMVRTRPEGQENLEIPTGQIEVLASGVEVISALSSPPPFLVEKGPAASEELRLKYRYLDLRRPRMSQMLVERDRLCQSIRSSLSGRGFTEVHTPILSNSSPEGARDFLIPSRLHPGQFFALPQAPQQWKQLLMASGVDRYFQIAPCFRDEAARADRSPGEFYQLDLEMAFVEQEDVLCEVEAAISEIAESFSALKLLRPFRRIKYHEAIERFGSDKPDLRFDLELRTLTEHFVDSSVRFLREAVATGSAVRALTIPGGAVAFSRREIEGLRALAQESGVTGLAWLAWQDDEVRGSLASAMEPAEREHLRSLLAAENGSLLLLCAGPRERIDVALNALRNQIGDRLKLRDPNTLLFLWVTDFPMYERDSESGAIEFSHNPFSMPQGGLAALREMDPLDIRAWQYDLVCNGMELSSGAIRNSDPETLYHAFGMVGYSREVVDQQFGHMVEAFRSGCPPHGGIAPGLERMLMLFTGISSIREVVPFPKNQKCQDLLTRSPSTVDKKLLDELGLKVVP
ncbi:MAG: aspartate--tRNA ligase [Candidatus Dormibacteraceae bacterium]